jgi:hypothetical protein
VSAEPDRRGALESVERILNRGGEADDVLRAVVAVLRQRTGRFCRISFVEGEELVPGPAAGDEVEAAAFPIAWQGRRVAELEVGGDLDAPDRALFERVAVLVSPYALVGWDTGGETWAP